MLGEDKFTCQHLENGYANVTETQDKIDDQLTHERSHTKTSLHRWGGRGRVVEREGEGEEKR